MDNHFGGVIWTNHALDRLRQRGIKQGDAWATWRNPEHTKKGSTPGSWVYYRNYGNTQIEVVAKQNEKHEWIILSVWSRADGETARRVVASSNKSLEVETAKVSKGNLVLSVSTSGTVDADQYSKLTFPSGGKIASVWVKAGDKVKKGQTIAALDMVSLAAAYQQALNNRRSTQATVDDVHDQLKDNTTESFSARATRTAAA